MRPGTSRIGVAWGYVPPSFPKEEVDPCYRELHQSALALGAQLHIEAISRPEGVAAGLAAIAESKPDAMLITAGPGFFTERHRVMQFAISKAIPTAADWLWPPDGELRPVLSYSPSFASNMRQVAPYIVRILAGHESASDLPFQLPARFELLLNRRTAKAIGLTIPRALLSRADAVID